MSNQEAYDKLCEVQRLLRSAQALMNEVSDADKDHVELTNAWHQIHNAHKNVGKYYNRTYPTNWKA